MTLKKWLKTTDILGLKVIIWSVVDWNEVESDPLFVGSSLDVPYWIADLKLADSKEIDYEQPISYRSSLGEKYNNSAGFVIVVKDE